MVSITHSLQPNNHSNPLTTIVEPAARILSPLPPVFLLVTLESVFTHHRGRFILLSSVAAAVTVPAARLQVEDVINCEFQRGCGSTWSLRFVHIHQGVNPPLTSVALLPLKL